MAALAPDPLLVGSSIALRPFRIDDAAAIADACRDPDIPRFTMMADGLTEAQAIEWVKDGHERWSAGVARFAIVAPPDDRCLGHVGVALDLDMRRAETFYWLERSARGNGFASEALELVTSWAFREFDIARCQLVTLPENVASQRVAERCGYVREGVLRAWEPVRDEQPDVVMYSRLAGEARDQPSG